MNFLAHFAFALSLTSPLIHMGPVSSISACIDERPWIPYTNPDLEKPGTMQILVAYASRDLNVRLKVEALPWKRCLADVRSGRIDAAIGASDAPFILQFAEFPRLIGSETSDTNRSLGTARIMLVKRIESSIDWDGATLTHLKKPIGTAMGTQAMRTAVLKFGGEVDDAARTDDQNLRKLLLDRVDLMAGYEFDLEEIIRTSYEGKVAILSTPLLESHYYLAFSKTFYRKHPALAETFWNKIANLRLGYHPARDFTQEDLTFTSRRSLH
ncbi:MAG: hypothetical protein V4655_04660 [Bdellovibrionota bacterium]